ncbi:biotin/methionine sulfoxide reductase [Azorhizobium sp. AG788]|uniref:molybdopterin-dependent oxidoreductase n=1 Tax=Azorhizobium sp. AG788 TaxID=2183897 RepID=UPI00105BA694|nr:molybdopterin-dependent oxidoreductase [Azorhizobium sp. AG788]TDT99797.1 biotin/methionine sulfoxide reductase [Azorhizobium sp. AG788]
MVVQRKPHLAHWGAFTALVEEGRLVGCEPFAADPAPSPLLGSIVPSVYSERRIQKPMVRESFLKHGAAAGGEGRGHEPMVEVSWETALDLAAREISRVEVEHGRDALFAGSYGWSSAGRLHHARSLVRRFYFSGGGAIDQVGNYSWGTAQFLLPHIIGTYQPLTGRATSWPSILKHCQLFLAFGGLALKNGQMASGGAAEHTQEHWLRELAKAGIPVINVSPTRGDCPDFLNAEWVPIRPTTDAAFLLALLSEVLLLEVADLAFLATHTVGFEPLAAYVRGESDGVPKTPEWAQDICGVPAERIRQIAARLVGVRSYITCSFAVQRAENGEQPYWLAIALASVLGQVGLPGGGFGFGHGSMNGVGNPRPATPGPEMAVGANPLKRAIPAARITEMLEAPGTPYPFNGRTETYPDVRLIHWAGGNPFHHHQDLNRFSRAWQKPETIIVNEIWWTPTARRADIVLPVTTTLERNDIGGSSRDRYVIAMHQAIAPLHAARSDFDIFADLAERLGHGAAFTGGLDEQGWIERIYTDCAAANAKAGITFPDFETFWQDGSFELPRPAQDFVLFADFRADPQAHPLATPSGRIELYSSAIAGFALPDCPPHPVWRAPGEWLGSVGAKRHPLHLVTVQPSDRLHSQLDFAPLPQGNKVDGREALLMHPDDAAARGCVAGRTVRVFNDRGALLAGLVLDEGVHRGVVVMATGAWFDPDPSAPDAPERAGTVNVLTRDVGTSSLTQGPNAMSCLVEVAAV